MNAYWLYAILTLFYLVIWSYVAGSAAAAGFISKPVHSGFNLVYFSLVILIAKSDLDPVLVITLGVPNFIPLLWCYCPSLPKPEDSTPVLADDRQSRVEPQGNPLNSDTGLLSWFPGSSFMTTRTKSLSPLWVLGESFSSPIVIKKDTGEVEEQLRDANGRRIWFDERGDVMTSGDSDLLVRMGLVPSSSAWSDATDELDMEQCRKLESADRWSEDESAHNQDQIEIDRHSLSWALRLEKDIGHMTGIDVECAGFPQLAFEDSDGMYSPSSISLESLDSQPLSCGRSYFEGISLGDTGDFMGITVQPDGGLDPENHPLVSYEVDSLLSSKGMFPSGSSFFKGIMASSSVRESCPMDAELQAADPIDEEVECRRGCVADVSTWTEDFSLEIKNILAQEDVSNILESSAHDISASLSPAPIRLRPLAQLFSSKLDVYDDDRSLTFELPEFPSFGSEQSFNLADAITNEASQILEVTTESSEVLDDDFAPLHSPKQRLLPSIILPNDVSSNQDTAASPIVLAGLSLSGSCSSVNLSSMIDTNDSFLLNVNVDVSELEDADFAPLQTPDQSCLPAIVFSNDVCDANQNTAASAIMLPGFPLSGSCSSVNLSSMIDTDVSLLLNVNVDVSELEDADFAPLQSPDQSWLPSIVLSNDACSANQDAAASPNVLSGFPLSGSCSSLNLSSMIDTNVSFLLNASVDIPELEEADFVLFHPLEENQPTSIVCTIKAFADLSHNATSMLTSRSFIIDDVVGDFSMILDAELDLSILHENDFSPLADGEYVDPISVLIPSAPLSDTSSSFIIPCLSESRTWLLDVDMEDMDMDMSVGCENVSGMLQSLEIERKSAILPILASETAATGQVSTLDCPIHLDPPLLESSGSFEIPALPSSDDLTRLALDIPDIDISPLPSSPFPSSSPASPCSIWDSPCSNGSPCLSYTSSVSSVSSIGTPTSVFSLPFRSTAQHKLASEYACAFDALSPDSPSPFRRNEEGLIQYTRPAHPTAMKLDAMVKRRQSDSLSGYIRSRLSS